MSFRRIAEICGAGSALALALIMATPAAAADAMPGDGPSYPAAAPDMRPEWRGGGYAAQVDPRARDAWLSECRHRTALYYYRGGHRHHHHHGHDKNMDPAAGYDYCEAYFDDYYRTYRQPGFGYIGYERPMMMMPPPAYQGSSGQREEVVTEEYVPLRSREIPHRRARHVIHDKRVRVAP